MQTYAKFVAPSNNSDFENEPTWNDAVSLLESAPTVDAVEVVRCKDCKCWNAYPTASSAPHVHECGRCIPRIGTTENHFCSWGERKDKTDLKEIK